MPESLSHIPYVQKAFLSKNQAGCIARQTESFAVTVRGGRLQESMDMTGAIPQRTLGVRDALPNIP